MLIPGSTPNVHHLVNDEPGVGFNVRVTTDAAQRLVIASGELDSATRDSLYQACITGPDVSVTVDLGSVTFMDCGGYTGLLTARRFLEDRGGSLTTCHETGQPARLVTDYFAPITACG